MPATVFPRRLPHIVAIALLVYLPWILFTTCCYGSPLPNTIVAKGLAYPKWWSQTGPITFFAVKRHTWMVLAEQLHVMLAPTFCGHGTGVRVICTKGPESPLANGMFVFAVLGTLAILFRRQWTLWPLAACVVIYGLYYVYIVPYLFGWYKAPYLAILLLISVRGLQELSRLLPWSRLRNGLLSVFAVAYVGLFVGVLPITFHAERQIQQCIENPVRKAAGMFLRGRIKADEAVGCEPLGYMAYYSRGNVYDWPGLASRTVVAWSKAHPGRRGLEEMLKDLRPAYLFLRDIEVIWFRDTAWLKADYHPIAVFAADPEQIKRIRWVRFNLDTQYRIYRKNHPDDPRPYDNALWP